MTNATALNNTLIGSGYLDTSQTAGGNHLTLITFLRQACKLGAKPTLYLDRYLQSDTKDFLQNMGCELLSLEQAKHFCSNPKNILFYYGWGSDSPDIIHKLNAKRYAIRPSALGHPYCSNATKQKDFCWNRCNKFKYFLHTDKHPQAIKQSLKVWKNEQTLSRAISINFATDKTIKLFLNRYAWFQTMHTNKTYELMQFASDEKNKLSWNSLSDAQAAVLMMSKWEPHKGLMEILTALQNLNLKFVIVGGGSEVEKAKAKFSHMNIDWLGHIPNDKILHNLPRYRYLYVHAARWYEVLGRTIIEAMYWGIPFCIATSTGINAELQQSEHWISFKQQELTQLTSKIEQFFAKPTTKYEKQTAFLSQQWQQFSTTTVFDNWIQYFGEIHSQP